jgi:hypothetical protein
LALLRHALEAALKSMAIVAGAGFGLLEALSCLGVSTAGESSQAIENRLDAIENEMLKMQTGVVTHDELSRCAEATLRQMETLMETRFEYQTRSIEALRVMIGQTDELLQRVLDGLDPREIEVEPANETTLSFRS